VLFSPFLLALPSNARLAPQAILAGLKKTMPAPADDEEKRMIEDRLSAFIVDNRRGKRVSIQFYSTLNDQPGCPPHPLRPSEHLVSLHSSHPLMVACSLAHAVDAVPAQRTLY